MIAGVVHALGIFEPMGQLSSEEAAEWRRAILDAHGLPVGVAQA